MNSDIRLTYVVGAITVILCSIACYYHSRVRRLDNVPIAGRRSNWEPSWLLRLRFLYQGRDIISQGYTQYRDIFLIHRIGADVVVIGSSKLLEEIRSQTRDSARSVQAFLNDFHSNYTQGQVFADSDLQNRVLQQRLIPRLSKLILTVVKQASTALEKEISSKVSTEWVHLDPLAVFPRVAASIVSRLWLGDVSAHNEEWVAITADFTRNVFLTGFALRFIPRPFRPLAVWLLPSYRSLRQNIRDARRLITELTRKGAPEKDMDGNHVLHWMIELGKDDELEVANLAQRMLILSLSGIHTTALTITQALYDLCAHPEHLANLKEEIKVLQDEETWTLDTLAKLDQMDSMMKESQRMNPVFLLTFQRILPCDVHLSNGVYLPAGTRIAVPQNAIANDPKLLLGGPPDTFLPWRYAQLRQQPGGENKFNFAKVDDTHMAFGYGKYACPGRAFVANEIKVILAHILKQYEFQLPCGQARPRNFTIDADMFPDPRVRLGFRRRPSGESFS